ncbi:MAG: DegT/DnrJ/EryC1/StrS family aminotransferase, partial [Alphaproteobacteria bacterium]|nr:DegT/DnrJ/EryC1/StrS family aminotransferase [Alphaproteobacteria bacterium]
MKKIIPWWHPKLGEKEKENLAKVIDSQFPNHGVYTVEFEKQVAAICHMPYAVAVTSGTAAICLSLKAAGVGYGDEVIIPDITFIATAHAVSLAGATPVIVDVRRDNLTIDVEKVREAITEKTKAVIPVHVSGRGASILELAELCKEKKLFLIEDAAESFGSISHGKPLGSYGFAGCISFTATKLLTTGQGGVVVVGDEETYYKIRALRDHGRPNRGTGSNDIHDTIGYNFKFTDLQASVGLAQLEQLNERLAQQKRLYQTYKRLIKDVTEVSLLPFATEEGESPLWVDAIAKDRDNLLNFLTNEGIETRKFWYPIHSQNPYKQDDSLFPVATEVSKEAFWLPSALSLKEEDIKFVCEKIKEFYSQKCSS